MLVAALAWTLYHMLQNPDVTERCRKEVDEVMEGRSFPTHEDLKKMKQLDLIMKESMCLTPVSPMGGSTDSYIPFPVEVQVGGAAVFVMPVERFEHF